MDYAICGGKELSPSPQELENERICQRRSWPTDLFVFYWPLSTPYHFPKTTC